MSDHIEIYQMSRWYWRAQCVSGFRAPVFYGYTKRRALRKAMRWYESQLADDERRRRTFETVTL